MAAQIFFLDTNVLLECRALEELPWKDLTDQDPIRLLIALTVIEEIDKRKHGNDRKADRARKASQRLREIRDAADEKISIRKAAPKVSLEIAPLYFPKAADFPDFDLSRGDNKIIAEIKHFSNGGPPGTPNEKSQELILKMDCCGNRPAEDFKVTLKCVGSLLLARPDRFVRSTESLLILPPAPDPFQAPRQPVRSPPSNLVETKTHTTELYFDLIPQGPQDQWTLSMEKFMHETRKELQFRLVANLASKSSSAELQCIVMAKNFAKSVTKTLSCKCKFIKKSARPIANRIIEDSKRK